MQAKEISIDPAKIEDFNGHRFSDVVELAVEDLTESMLEDGFDDDHPVSLAQDGDRFFIVNGRHRTLASIAAGISSIPAIVVSWDDFSDLMDEIGCLERVSIAIEYAAS